MTKEYSDKDKQVTREYNVEITIKTRPPKLNTSQLWIEFMIIDIFCGKL